jgi:hypothetical protein
VCFRPTVGVWASPFDGTWRAAASGRVLACFAVALLAGCAAEDDSADGSDLAPTTEVSSTSAQSVRTTAPPMNSPITAPSSAVDTTQPTTANAPTDQPGGVRTSQGTASEMQEAESLAVARSGFTTTLTSDANAYVEVASPPEGVFELAPFTSDVGDLASYLDERREVPDRHRIDLGPGKST